MFLQNLKSVALPVSEIIGGTQKFGQPLDTPTLPFLHFLWSFIRIGPVNVLAKFEVRIALPFPEIIGGTQKIWTAHGYAHTPFSPKFLRGYYSE